MAEMNYRILKKINKEIEYEENEGLYLDDRDAIIIDGKKVRPQYEERYHNLLDLKDMLEKANTQKNNLYLFGEIGIVKGDYFNFMHLMHDSETDIPIPSNLFIYGMIPGCDFPAPPIAPDNKDVKDIELEYQLFYAKHGIVPEFENGIRKPYPHEMYNWDKNGAIDSSYGKAHNYYYEKRYLVSKMQELNKASKDDDKEKEKKEPKVKKPRKRFRILERKQATDEQVEKMANSVDKNDQALKQKKKFRTTLILCGIAVAVPIIAFNASVIIPAMVSNPAFLPTLVANTPKFLFGNLGKILLHLGLPTAAFALVLRKLIKDNKKNKGNDENKTNSDADTNENKETKVDPKDLMADLKQRIIENEQKIANMDAEIEKAKAYKVPINGADAVQAQKEAMDKIRKLQADKEELLRLKHQILDEMAAHTMTPGSGGMKR